MVNYENGRIYKLVSDQSDMFYIGSTTQRLSKRLSCHKAYIKSEKSTTHLNMREHTNIRIELIENVACSSKEELHAREGYWIRQHRDQIVNQTIPGRTDSEWREEHSEELKEKQKGYREKQNLEKRKEYHKERYKNNREQILEQNKAYKQANRDKINENRRLRQQAKKAQVTSSSSVACA